MTTQHMADSAGGFAGTTFFTGTYDETLDLLVRSRAYLMERSEQDYTRLPDGSHRLFALESLRLTSRLTRLMAWLLAQRAVHVGQMRPGDALDESFRLSNIALCVGKAQDDSALPEPLRHLLSASYNLYQRVARLDEMLRRDQVARDSVN